MAIADLSSFPQTIVAGDTTRILLRNGDYPSSSWTLSAYLRGPDGTVTPVAATAEDDDGFAIVIPTDLAPGGYSFSLRFTEIASSESITDGAGSFILLPDPSQAITKSVTRLTLEAAQAAMKLLVSGPNQSINFNGQSFTKQNPKELQDIIDRLQAKANAEDRALGLPAPGGAKRIVTRFT